MKRILSVMMLTLWVGGALWAQTGTWHKQTGNVSKKVKADLLEQGIYVGSAEGMAYWVSRTEEGGPRFKDDDNLQVVVLDSNLYPLSQREILGTDRSVLMAAAMDSGVVSLMAVDSSRSKQTTVLGARVDFDGMHPEGYRCDTLAHYVYGRKDRCYVWAGTSPNGRYMGLVVVVQYVERKEYMAVASMYDSQLNLLWGKEFALGTTDQLTVTDDGRIVTFGTEEHVGGEYHFIVNNIEQRNAVTYAAVVTCDPVYDMKMVRVMDRRVICAGLYEDVNARKLDQCGGVVTLAFDFDSSSLAGFTMRPFQNEEVNIMRNKKTKQIHDKLFLDYVRPQGYAQAPWGGVFAVGRHYVEHYADVNGIVSDAGTHYAMGIQVTAVDTNGEVMWVRNFRRNDVQPDDEPRLFVSLTCDDSSACLIKSESPKYPDIYDIAKEAKEWKSGSKSNLVLYRIAANGDVSKTLLEGKTKQMLIQSVELSDGSLQLLTQQGGKTRSMWLKYDKGE